ncbi:MAG: NADH-quinone oxidoreductase subunit N [Thermodesulfobacteriota bacterium]
MESIIAQISFQAIYPEIVIAATAMIILLLQAFSPRESKKVMGYLSLAGVILSALMLLGSPGGTEYSFSGTWVIDNYSRFFKLLFLLCTGLTILISLKYLKEEGIHHGEYFAILLFATVGMMIMVSGADFITIFLGLELMSICLYVLTGYTRGRQISNEAALKYFVLGSFATGFLLYGIALFYGAAGSTSLKSLADITVRNSFQNYTIIIGMVLMIIGFGFKIAVVPFHMWTPDVYQGAPAPITGFMSAGPKAAAFAALIRIFVEALPSARNEWVDLVWILAVLTMTVGNVVALVQDNVKRMLAYSSIAHAGYIMVAFIAAREMGISSVLFYLLAYTFMNLGAFAIITVIGGRNEERVNVQDFAGFGYRNPVAAVMMSLFLFSLAGIPPTAGFMGKFYIFSAAIKEGFLGLALIGVVNSVISVYYYLRVTIAMYMKEPETAPAGTMGAVLFPPAIIIAILISAYGVLRMGIFPSDFIQIAQQSLIAIK